MRVRLVRVDNTYIGTAEINHDADVLVFDGFYYIPTGIMWFDLKGECPVYRQADAMALLHCDLEVENLDERSNEAHQNLPVLPEQNLR